MSVNNKNSGISSTRQALSAIKSMQAKIAGLEKSKHEPIAVVGVACRFPGNANSPEALWEMLKSGKDGIVEVPSERWDADAFYDPDPDVPGKMVTRLGGFLKDIDQFDPAFFGISPREAGSMDPHQRLLLQVAWEALENGGFDANALYGSRTGVYVGISNFEYGARLIWPDNPEHITAYSGTGGSLGVTAGRLSYTFGFTGPSMIIDTACSSSLVTTHLAMQALRLGECDFALSAGVNLIFGPQTHINFSKARMLSPDGHCKTFSADADGYARGEGVGVVLLKRLSDAERDGDNILALMRGSAVNQDGPSGGLTVPNGPSQVSVIRSALENARIEPDEVGYIEAHGTGTPLGDPIEMGALAAVFGSRKNGAGKTPEREALQVASIKTNVGHLESAAGIAGLIKSILSVHHGQIPPHCNLRSPNPDIDWEAFPVNIPDRLTDWPAEERIAGVSSFSFSGTNAHLVLSNYRADNSIVEYTGESSVHSSGSSQNTPAKSSSPPAAKLLTLSSRNKANLQALTDAVKEDLKNLPDDQWGNYCVSAARGRGHYNYRLAVAAESASRAADLLASETFITGKRSAATRRIAFLFTGQGSQYIHMGRQLFEQEPGFREAMEKCEKIVSPLIGRSMLELLYPSREDPDSEVLIDQTQFTQPLLFSVEYSLAQLWRAWGMEPEALIGHSLGELTAAAVAGLLSLEDALTLVCSRGRLMEELCDKGAMAAIKMTEVDVKARIQNHSGLTIASINGPQSVVVAGDMESIDKLIGELTSAEEEVKKLRVSHAFHSSLVDPMVKPFQKVASGIRFGKLKIPVISNITGSYTDAEAMGNAAYWCDHIQKPVRFFDGLSHLIADGFDTFIEIGPKPTLSALGHTIADELDLSTSCEWLPSMRYHSEARDQMLQSLGHLYVLGVDAAAIALTKDGTRYPVPIPTTPFEPGQYWYSHADIQEKTRHVFGGHPLLGQRFSTPLLQAGSILFANDLSAGETSFLAHHQVFGQIVLPAAAHLEMALAASDGLFPSPATVDEVEIQRALILSDEQPISVQTVLHPSGDGFRFEIFSQAQPTESWQLHTTGKLSVPPPGSPGRLDLDLLQKRCAKSVDVTDYYNSSTSLGIEHGEDFQALKSLWQGEGEMLGRLELSAGMGGNDDYLLHPVLMDAAFQMASYPLIREASAYLPTGVESVSRMNPLPRKVWCLTTLKHPDPAGELQFFETDLKLADDEGRVLAEVTGLRFQRVDRHSLAVKGTQYDSWLYQIDWQKKPLYGLGTGFLQSPDGIAASLSDQTEKAAEACAFYEAMFADMDLLSADFVQKELLESGWNPEPGQKISADDLVQKMKIVKSFEPLFERCLSMLQEDGILRKEETTWEVLKPFEGLPVVKVAELRQRFEEAGPEMTLFFRCAEALGSVWRGETNPLNLLFPEGDLNVTTLLYEHSTGARSINRILSDAVLEAIRVIPVSRGIRILEIGGGTGGTTAHLLPHLPADRCEYLFTDISPHFTQQAEKRFNKDYPFTRFATLDIEKDPGPDLEGHFDLVIAANVVHATRRLDETLDHCKSLLAPGGMLVLLEASAKQRWLDLTFGMTEGWWRFLGQDSLREDYPLLTPGLWKSVLTSRGFDLVALLGPDSIEGVDGLKQHVILARNQTESIQLPPHVEEGEWLLVGEKSEQTTGLAEKLPGRVTHLTALQISEESGEPGKLNELLAKPLKGIVMLHALDSEESISSAGQLLSFQHHLVQPFLHLARALGTLEIPTVPRLWVVTRDAIAFDGKANGFAQASLHGLVRTLNSEHPDLKPILLDLAAGDESEENDTVSQIWLEIQSGDSGEQVLLRGGGRYVSRLMRRKGESGIPMELEEDASYLITGGLGDIGLRIARYLVSGGARHLVLMSRSAPGEEARAVLAELEELGAVVEIAQIDVTDGAAVRELLASSDRPPLRGVVHAAGTLADGVLAKMEWDQFESVMRAKVMGAWNLHHATEEQSLDFFILFSSIGSVFGPAGQGNYAAANAFLDQFAGWRRGQNLPALSINWGAWSEIGLAARQVSSSQVGAMRGITPIHPDEGIAVFDSIRNQQAEVMVVPIDWPVLFEYLSDMPLLDTLRTEMDQLPVAEVTDGEWFKQLNGLPEMEQYELLLEHVSQQAARVLGASVDSLDVTAGFFDLGMDSLTSVELRNALQGSLGIDLPSTLIFKYPTISAVSDYLVGEVNKKDIDKESQGTSNGYGKDFLEALQPDESQQTDRDISELSEEELNALIDDEFNNLGEE